MTSVAQIPFNRPSLAGSELKYLSQAVSAGHISGNGPFTRQAEAILSEMHQGSSTLLTTSCTHSLEMSARLLNLNPSDEVIVPAYTFVSSASAFTWNGARPVFADIRLDTMNIDPVDAERLITERTRAICIVHYAGVGADPDKFADLGRRYSIPIIEDNAHGLGSSYKGQTLGTFGALSTLSFHETKNLSCGEGGAIVINDSSLVERAEILREKGTDRSKFLRGQVDKYTWVDNGSSWVMSDLLAAFLVAQLEGMEAIQADRLSLWQRYDRELGSWAAQNQVVLPYIPPEAHHSGHMFYLRLANQVQRDHFIAHLKSLGVMAVFHYQALNTSPQGLLLGADPTACPNSKKASETLVRLPLFRDMSEQEQGRVIDAVVSFRSE